MQMCRPLACHVGEKGIFECVFKQKWQICRGVSNNGFRAGVICYNGKNVKSPYIGNLSSTHCLCPLLLPPHLPRLTHPAAASHGGHRGGRRRLFLPPLAPVRPRVPPPLPPPMCRLHRPLPRCLGRTRDGCRASWAPPWAGCGTRRGRSSTRRGVWCFCLRCRGLHGRVRGGGVDAATTMDLDAEGVAGRGGGEIDEGDRHVLDGGPINAQLHSSL
jgi:hypothetical protein